MIERLTHWPTTGFGLAIGGVVAYAFTTLGCRVPDNWTTFVVGALSALPGILAKK